MEGQQQSGSISLKHDSVRGAKRKLEKTDHTLCIICQGKCTRNMLNVTQESLPKLHAAMEGRCDETAVRLQTIAKQENWFRDNTPKWHRNCKNKYLLKKSVSLAKQRRMVSVSPTRQTDGATCSTSITSPAKTRSKLPQYQAKTMCVICNKIWHRGKRPCSKVTTKNRECKIRVKAQQLKRQDVLLRISGKEHDMVSNDICYHKHCMDVFTNTRVPRGKSEINKLYEQAFMTLVKQVDELLFQKSQGVVMSTLRTMYQQQLSQLGVIGAHRYRSSSLKEKLANHYGSRITIMDQSYGPAFVCGATIPIGDALEQLKSLHNNNINKQQEDKKTILKKAAKILRADAKVCNKMVRAKESIDISLESAAKIVPDSFYNFTSHLLSDKTENVVLNDRISISENKERKALMLSQQMLQHTGVATPLSIGTTYNLYNQTRSKSLITLNNTLKQGISYDTLQRQLTAKSTAIQQQVEENGVYIPENMTAGNHHVFAMDNLDWKNNTMSGGSFNATSAIIIETPENLTGDSDAEPAVSVKTTATRPKALTDVSEPSLPECYISKNDRQKSRSLANIPSIDSLQTETDNFADNLLLLWKLGRLARTSDLINVSIDDGVSLPGFPAFCARLSDKRKANKIGYLPLIPQSPTNPAVLKEEMVRLMNTSHALGHQWTIITGDQATYELAMALRLKHSDIFGKVVLLLGGFHQAHNYVKAICKIVQGSGAEELIVSAGLCSEATAKKIIGERGDYYQTLNAIRILSEAFTQLYWQAFEKWAEQSDSVIWNDKISHVIEEIVSNEISVMEQTQLIVELESHLTELQNSLDQFNHSLQSKPTAVFWLTFLEMTDILHKFIYYQREGIWLGSLKESAKMLPYMAAAGHHKYGQQSLPLFIHEMKELPFVAPSIHRILMNGAFVGRRADGHHNAVSPDMLLEQTYNADAKEKSGLTGITTSKCARTKWVHTKHFTATVSSDFKMMIDRDSTAADGDHHESGETRVLRNIEQVLRMIQVIDENPYISESDHLLNIVTGEHAQQGVQSDLTCIKEIGENAVSHAIVKQETKIVKLKTFHTQHQKSKKVGNQQRAKQTDEMTALLRMTQLIACGENVDVVNTVGNYECSVVPLSLFNEDSTMRVKGAKASLVKVLLKETNVKSIPSLPETGLSTAVIVDAMHSIRKWSFKKGENFSTIANCYLQKLLDDVPPDTQTIHFCCDRYRDASLKTGMRQQRKTSTQMDKSFEVNKLYSAPEALNFFALDRNKASLLNFICTEWTAKPLESTQVQLCIGGGFKEETKTLLVTSQSVSAVPELESCQEEADTRIILHTIHAAENGTKRVIVHANDTDVIVLCIYYASTDFLSGLHELWVRSEHDNYLPIHEITAALGPSLCQRLPFIHSLSGRDITSYPFHTGKKAWLEAMKNVDTPAIEIFGVHDNELSDEVLQEAIQICIQVYSKKDESFDDIPSLRAHKFLKQRSSLLLKLLPPTEDAFRQHVKRCALATIIDKRAHLAQQNLPPYKYFGWAGDDPGLPPDPIRSTTDHWPEHMSMALSCNCKTGCSRRNCSCSRRGVSCYIGCRCTGTPDKCIRCQAINPGPDSD